MVGSRRHHQDLGVLSTTATGACRRFEGAFPTRSAVPVMHLPPWDFGLLPEDDVAHVVLGAESIRERVEGAHAGGDLPMRLGRHDRVRIHAVWSGRFAGHAKLCWALRDCVTKDLGRTLWLGNLAALLHAGVRTRAEPWSQRRAPPLLIPLCCRSAETE